MIRLPDPRDRPWLTVAEVAEITGEGEKAIRAALDAGQLPLLRIGRYVRIPTARLYQLLGMTADRGDEAGSRQDPAAAITADPGGPNSDVQQLHGSRSTATAAAAAVRLLRR